MHLNKENIIISSIEQMSDKYKGNMLILLYNLIFTNYILWVHL